MRRSRTAVALASVALLGSVAAGCNLLPRDCSPEHLAELQAEDTALTLRLGVLIQIVNTSTDPAEVAAAQAESRQLTARHDQIADDLTACEQ